MLCHLHKLLLPQNNHSYVIQHSPAEAHIINHLNIPRITMVIIPHPVLPHLKDEILFQYADRFHKPRIQHEHQNALLIFTYGTIFRKSGINERRERGMISSGHKRDGERVLGTLGCSHDDGLLLDSKERHPHRGAFQEFEEMEVHALNLKNDDPISNLYVLTFTNVYCSMFTY